MSGATESGISLAVAKRYIVANAPDNLNTLEKLATSIGNNTDIKGYVDNLVATTIGAAPATLDTLAEITAAIADDPDFYTKVGYLAEDEIVTGTWKLQNGVIVNHIKTDSVDGTDNQSILLTSYDVATSNKSRGAHIIMHGEDVGGNAGNLYLVAGNSGTIRAYGNIVFETVEHTIAGIQNQNLIDKSLSQVISPSWTFQNTINFATNINLTGSLLIPSTSQIAGITASNLLDKTATETISGTWTYGGFQTYNVHTYHKGSSYYQIGSTVYGKITTEDGNIALKAEPTRSAYVMGDNVVIYAKDTGGYVPMSQHSIAGGHDWKGYNFTNVGNIGFAADATLTGNVTITGTLVVQGSSFQVDQNIVTSDAVIDMNAGEVGAGVTLGYAGTNVDRGTANDYFFGFDEVRDLFVLGEYAGSLDATAIAGLQAVATRIDSPGSGHYAYWESANNRLNFKATIPAADIAAGTFGSGNYTFSADVLVTGGAISISNSASFTRGSSKLEIYRGTDGKDRARVEMYTGSTLSWIAGMTYNNGSLTPEYHISRFDAISSGTTSGVSAFKIDASDNATFSSAVTMGALTATSGNFSGNLTVSGTTTTLKYRALINSSSAGGNSLFDLYSDTDYWRAIHVGSDNSYRLQYNGSSQFTLTSAGALSLTGGLGATTGTFSGSLTAQAISGTTGNFSGTVTSTGDIITSVIRNPVSDDTTTIAGGATGASGARISLSGPDHALSASQFSVSHGATTSFFITGSSAATFNGSLTLIGTRDTTTASAANMYINPTTGLTYRSTSSKRYKTDIKPLAKFVSDDLYLSWNPVRYRSKSDNQYYFGFIAEQTHDIGLTELVDYRNGKPENVHYNHATALNTLMIQRLIRRVSELENRLAA